METRQRMAKAVEEDDSEKHLIEVSVGTLPADVLAPLEDSDPFAKSLKDIDLSGISSSLKRKSTRLSKSYTGTGGAKSKKNEIPLIALTSGYSLFNVVVPPYNLDSLAALFEKSEAHAAACKAKARNIVGLGYDWVETDATKNVVDEASDNEKKVQRIRRKLATEKVALNDWLDSCNVEDTFTEVLLKVWIDYESTGNGYIEVGRTTSGQIGYIGHIPSTTMRIRQERDGYVQIIANKVVFFRNFGDRKTANPVGNDDRPNEVIHLKKYSPTNGYYGVPDIVSALSSVAGNDFAARFNIDYFENKAVPRYVIVIKGATLSPRAERQILEFFQANIKGQNHRTLYVPLPADEDGKKVSFEMKPVETSVQEASFNNYRKANINSILMAHAVPITKVSAADNISLAAARDLDKTFKEQVARPEQRVFEKKINKIVKEVTQVFSLKMNELSLTDEDTQSKIDERNIRNQIVVPNEIRARKGLPGLPGGDKVVELKPQQAAEARAQTSGSRQRDQQRTNNQTDTAGEARNPKGDGKTTP